MRKLTSKLIISCCYPQPIEHTTNTNTVCSQCANTTQCVASVSTPCLESPFSWYSVKQMVGRGSSSCFISLLKVISKMFMQATLYTLYSAHHSDQDIRKSPEPGITFLFLILVILAFLVTNMCRNMMLVGFTIIYLITSLSLVWNWSKVN